MSMRPDELDVACAVARIEQVGGLQPGDAFREELIERLVTCDAPRLRGLLSADAVSALDAAGTDEAGGTPIT